MARGHRAIGRAAVVAGLLAIGASGCARDRAEVDPAAAAGATLPRGDAARAVKVGSELSVGMTPGMVTRAWGEPSHRDEVESAHGPVMQWAWSADSQGPARSAEFLNGRVVRWQVEK